MLKRYLLTASLLAAAACDRGPRAAPPAQSIVVASPSELQALNPLVNTDAATEQVLLHVLFTPLLRLDDSLHYAPALAESWTWSGDTALTMKLRRDALWHDGQRITARDVAFTFDRIKDEKTAFPAADRFAAWDNAQVVDSFSIRFRVKPSPDPLIGWTLTPIVPAHALDTVPAEHLRDAQFNTRPVGNGPFQFAAHEGNQWTFVANKNYPVALGGPPKLERLIWRIIPDNSAQITELRTGAADIILSARAEQARQLDSLPDFRAQITPSRRYLVIGWNEKRPVFRDARVRRALAMALNRAQMLTVLRGGYGQLAGAPVAPFQWMYDPAVKPLPYDTAAARALLDSAGVTQPLRFELKIPANNQFNADLAEMIRADLDRVGVKVSLRPTEFATLIEDISSPARRFDAVLTGFEVDYLPDFRELFHSHNLAGPMQMAQYHDARMDSLLDQIAVTTDRNAARPLWSEVQRKIRDEQPWTVLWFAPQIVTLREQVKGVDTDIRGWLVNVTRWRIE